MKNLKIIFMGTPDFAVPILQTLIENTNVVLVVSQPDKLVGRKKVLTESPVSKLANENGIEVFKPVKIREEYAKILKTDADIIITCAYGQIIPKVLLEYPKLGAINVHASLLPKYRGGAPIHRAIMNGDKVSGITIMYMDEHMDSGDIISQREVEIKDTDTIDTLSLKMSVVGSKLLIDTLPSIIEGTNTRIKQNEEEVTFSYIVKREDELIDFSKTSKEIYNQIRALNSKPGAYFLLDGKQIKVFEAKIGDKTGTIGEIINVYKDSIGIATNDGEIMLTKIQPEGKSLMSVKDYLNGKTADMLLGKKCNDRMD